MAYKYGYKFYCDQKKGSRVEIGYTQSSYKDTVIHLPHSCDKWVIGDVEDVKALIADLYRAIDKWNETKENDATVAC